MNSTDLALLVRDDPDAPAPPGRLASVTPHMDGDEIRFDATAMPDALRLFACFDGIDDLTGVDATKPFALYRRYDIVGGEPAEDDDASAILTIRITELGGGMAAEEHGWLLDPDDGALNAARAVLATLARRGAGAYPPA